MWEEVIVKGIPPIDGLLMFVQNEGKQLRELVKVFIRQHAVGMDG